MDMPKHQFIKIGMTVVFLALIIVCAVPRWNDHYVKPNLAPLDVGAQDYLNSTLIKAVAAYGTCRAINAAVSVVQDSEVTISVGAGASIALGEALDPLNDIIERFSVVMLYATVSLSTMQVLLKLGHWIGISLLLPIALTLMVVSIWTPENFFGLKKWGLRLFFVALLIRLFIPVTMYANQKVHDLFLEETYIKATIELDQDLKPIEVDTASPVEDQSWWETLKAIAAGGSGLALKMGAQIKALKDLSKDIVGRIISLIMVFMLQTAIIPLLALFVFYKVSSLVCGAEFTVAAKNRAAEAVTIIQTATTVSDNKSNCQEPNE